VSQTSRSEGQARPVTQKDVARLAGVHRASVSRALDPNRRDLINPETVARILEAAETLGYRPNAMARGLKTNRSRVIALVVPDIASPTYASIVSSLESAAREAGYTVLIANTGDELATVAAVSDRLAASRVDGVVFASAVRGEQALRAAGLDGIPIVFIGGPQPGRSSVSVDHHRGIEIAVDHLVRLGHSRIALICERPTSSAGAAHAEAYATALRAHDLEPDPRLVEVFEPARAVAGAEACSALFYRGAAPTAIIATNDGAALACYSALAGLGLEVPRDVSVVGYGNTPYGRYFSPPLTTIALPFGLIGTEAARIVLELIEASGGPEEPRQVQLRPYLVQRLSTARCPPRP
jgi:LacI family transcriptional regulator